ncbi:phenylalanine--tRNA ligase subunit beta [Bacteroidota bacterium]
MKISYNWLKEYFNKDIRPEALGEVLTNTGLEVEGTESFQSIKGGLEGLIIGEVKSCIQHPNADKLSLNTVDIGKEELLSIVCGAPNVAKGQKVIVAPVDTVLFMGENSFKIKRTKIRGELSEGMICSEDEVGLGTMHEGIIVLDKKAVVGSLVKDYYKVENDTIFEIGLTPNRIDGASHIGCARDVVAYFRQFEDIKLQIPSIKEFQKDNSDRSIEVSVENTKACPRYTGITITDLKVKESPDWLKTRLNSIGLRPINNIVDITNFVLHETGQPLHAFDADLINGGKIIVKTLPEGSKFITLDEEEIILSAEDLMICDSKGGMCIGGVFGGINSGVSNNTKDIFLESAYFNPVSIRKSAKRHLFNTDASFRFERGVDPNNTLYALKRAALLIKEIAGGKISSDITDIYPEKIEKCRINLSYSHVDRLTGNHIEPKKIKNILESLDIEIINEEETGLELIIPSYRVDVTREADVIEEILRIYGYNNIKISNDVKSTIIYYPKPDPENVQNVISNMLSGGGFSEIMSNSLTKSSYYKELKCFPDDNSVKIANPLSSDLDGMRQSLIFGGLESISYNINRKNKDLKLYEFGNCYYFNKKSDAPDPLKKYDEEKHLALFITGLKSGKNWDNNPGDSSFFEIKAYVENIISRLGINLNIINEEKINNEIISTGLSLKISSDTIAEFGIINTNILEKFDIEQIVYYANIHWDTLLKKINLKINYNAIPKFPEVKRDLALLIDKNVSFESIKKIAFNTEKYLLKKVDLFDVFEDDKIGKDKKSYAVSFIIQDYKRTLTDKQIDKIMNKLQKAFENELGAKIR